MPMQRELYPRNWPRIARRLKEAANWTCAFCGTCRGDIYTTRHSEEKRASIGVAHLDHNPWRRDARLAVLCSRCHLRYDAQQTRRKRRMMQIARGQLVLPGMGRWYQAPRVSLRPNAPMRARTRRAQKRKEAA